MARLQREARAAILQAEAAIARHDAAAEALVVAVDERAGVALAVHRAEVDRVRPAGQRARLSGRCQIDRRVRLDEPAPLRRVGLAQQPLDRHRGARRIGHVGPRVGERQPNRLDRRVQRLDRARRRRRDVDSFENVQRDQRRDPLAVGRALVDRVAAVGRRERRLECRAVRGQIVQRHAAAVQLQRLDDRPRRRAPVEGVGAAFGDGAQHPRDARIAPHLARARRALAEQQIAARRPLLAQQLLLARPAAADHRRDREALFGQLDRRRERLAQRHPSEAAQRVRPAGDRARRGHRVRALPLETLRAAGPLQRQRGGAAPAPVDRLHRPVRCAVEEAEAVAADPRRVGLDHRQRRGCGHRRVGRVAARLQHPHPRQRRQRLARRHGAARREHRRAARLPANCMLIDWLGHPRSLAAPSPTLRALQTRAAA